MISVGTAGGDDGGAVIEAESDTATDKPEPVEEAARPVGVSSKIVPAPDGSVGRIVRVSVVRPG